MTPIEVRLLMDDLLTTLPQVHRTPPLLARALEISVQFRHNVYDCFYVSLADREGCELLTADQVLIGKLQPAFPFITSLSSLS